MGRAECCQPWDGVQHVLCLPGSQWQQLAVPVELPSANLLFLHHFVEEPPGSTEEFQLLMMLLVKIRLLFSWTAEELGIPSLEDDDPEPSEMRIRTERPRFLPTYYVDKYHRYFGGSRVLPRRAAYADGSKDE